MRLKAITKSDSGQFWWLILLLAIAVALPAVCLLWFMTQAVRNAQLAARQLALDTYNDRLVEAARLTDEAFSAHLNELDAKLAQAHPYGLFEWLVTNEGYAGALVYGGDGERLYPLLSTDANVSDGPSEQFSEAWRLEFEEGDCQEAVRIYEASADANDARTRLKALIGKSRCLGKLEKWDEAAETCKQAAFDEALDLTDAGLAVLTGDARLLLMGHLKRDVKYAALFEETFQALLSMAYASDETALPADYNLFLAGKLLEILSENPFLEKDPHSIRPRLEKLSAAEQISIDTVRVYPAAPSAHSQPADMLVGQRPPVGNFDYSLYHEAPQKSILLLLSREKALSMLSGYRDIFSADDTGFRLSDGPEPLFVKFTPSADEPFMTSRVSRFLPGWKIELYFTEANALEKTASKQVAIYIWAGALVILLVLAAGGLAGRAVGRQIRLNKLKNNFIATVTHELKTPLASMRVLVDTLLEGRYKGQTQAAEYLGLISKENERLSRMIDNFLTFSRMERNKQAFEMLEVSPAVIARRAAEVMKTKFDQGQCRFDMSIGENLPDVLADHDAMVTAVVNLLDNAYKYSYDDRQITLRVFAEDGSVCFCVGDNGVGLSRRAAKRIFSRFYQVDRSLSRRAEGCGLGLSIVKFIVDAHKGSISVESKPGKGSVFTIKLRAIE